MVKVTNPQTLVVAYNMAKLYEQSQNAAKQHTYNSIDPVHFLILITKPVLSLFDQKKYCTTLNTKPPLPKNPTIEAIRERNICFYCHEKYRLGYQCKNMALNALEGEENFVEASDGELKNEAEAIIQEAQGEVSLNVVMGLSHSPNTIRVAGWAKKQ